MSLRSLITRVTFSEMNRELAYTVWMNDDRAYFFRDNNVSLVRRKAER